MSFCHFTPNTFLGYFSSQSAEEAESLKRQLHLKDDELDALDKRFKESSKSLKEAEEQLEEAQRYHIGRGGGGGGNGHFKLLDHVSLSDITSFIGIPGSISFPTKQLVQLVLRSPYKERYGVGSAAFIVWSGKFTSNSITGWCIWVHLMSLFTLKACMPGQILHYVMCVHPTPSGFTRPPETSWVSCFPHEYPASSPGSVIFHY